MAFIEKKDPTVLNILLTSCGRELLSTGNLTFNYYAIGDSEVDYGFNLSANTEGFVPFDSNILRPFDKNPKQLSFIPRNYTGDPYNVISTIPSASYEIVNQVSSIGFFNSGATTFITDSDHVKQPDCMVDMSTVAGGTSLALLKAPTYGSSGDEPAIGDLVLVKWTAGDSTTGYSVNKNYPTPYLIYQITGKTGSLGGNDLVVGVDRELPDLSALLLTSHAGAMVYYNYINFSGDTIFSDFGTDYLDEAVLSFLQNSQCPTVVFPFWNMSIIFTEEIAGAQFADRKYTQFNSRGYGGFVSYIQNQAPVYKKLGVIHYTNSSPANVYGEGFYQDTPVLEIPTVMWHKSVSKTLGTTLTPIGGVQTLSGDTVSLDARYYDLADEQGFVVGKVFIDMKMFVIEDQELLFAMSYKSNRSWTLPDYEATTNDNPSCPVAASTVIWTTPTIQDPADVCIRSQCYCYVSGTTGGTYSSGWIPFSIGSTVCHTNVVNAGYKVVGYACMLTGVGGSRLCVYACDYVNDYCIVPNCTVYGDMGSVTQPATLSCINHTNNYCFGGNIDED